MWVIQLGGDSDLPQETLGPDGRSQFWPQYLDRHLALMLEIVGAIDGGHTAGPDLALYIVVAGERGLQTIKDIGHGSITVVSRARARR